MTRGISAIQRMMIRPYGLSLMDAIHVIACLWNLANSLEANRHVLQLLITTPSVKALDSGIHAEEESEAHCNGAAGLAFVSSVHFEPIEAAKRREVPIDDQ